MVEASAGDIRSCLNTLQFLLAGGPPSKAPSRPGAHPTLFPAIGPDVLGQQGNLKNSPMQLGVAPAQHSKGQAGEGAAAYHPQGLPGEGVAADSLCLGFAVPGVLEDASHWVAGWCLHTPPAPLLPPFMPPCAAIEVGEGGQGGTAEGVAEERQQGQGEAAFTVVWAEHQAALEVHAEAVSAATAAHLAATWKAVVRQRGIAFFQPRGGKGRGRPQGGASAPAPAPTLALTPTGIGAGIQEKEAAEVGAGRAVRGRTAVEAEGGADGVEGVTAMECEAGGGLAAAGDGDEVMDECGAEPTAAAEGGATATGIQVMISPSTTRIVVCCCLKVTWRVEVGIR